MTPPHSIADPAASKLAQDIRDMQDMQHEYDSLLERWKDAQSGSQEVADLHATFKARERALGKLVERGLFSRVLAALPPLPLRVSKHVTKTKGPKV